METKALDVFDRLPADARVVSVCHAIEELEELVGIVEIRSALGAVERIVIHLQPDADALLSAQPLDPEYTPHIMVGLDAATPFIPTCPLDTPGALCLEADFPTLTIPALSLLAVLVQTTLRTSRYKLLGIRQPGNVMCSVPPQGPGPS